MPRSSTPAATASRAATTIPLARDVPTNGSAAAELLDTSALEALGPANWVAAPLDAADGSVVGLLLATGPDGQGADARRSPS